MKIMKTHTRIKPILTVALLATLTAATSSAATYTWTGAGADSNVIDAADNWANGDVAASGKKLGTGPATVGGATDTISFDSETATALPTSPVEAVRISSGNQFPNFELLNGTLNFNRGQVWAHPSTTFTIGDGDSTTAAQANFENQVDFGKLAAVTYNIESDGTLQINDNFVYSSLNGTVMNLLGGSINSTGSVSNGLTNQAGNVISFQSFDSSFTAAFGGQFATITDVNDQLDDSFTRTVGSAWSVTDNGSTFTVAPVPEPSSFALIAGMFGLTWVMLRRRA